MESKPKHTWKNKLREFNGFPFFLNYCLPKEEIIEALSRAGLCDKWTLILSSKRGVSLEASVGNESYRVSLKPTQVTVAWQSYGQWRVRRSITYAYLKETKRLVYGNDPTQA